MSKLDEDSMIFIVEEWTCRTPRVSVPPRIESLKKKSAKNRNCFRNDQKWKGRGDSSLLSAHISGKEIYSRFMSRLQARCLLGCSQQEGVATCLHSVLQQPSCGPTLVDFSEITWHPDCGWLQGDCCLCRTLLWSALASFAPFAAFTTYPLQKVLVFEHMKNHSIRQPTDRHQKANKWLSFYFYFQHLRNSLD